MAREENYTATTKNGSKINITKVISYGNTAWTNHIATYYYIYRCEELDVRDLKIVKDISGHWYTTFTGKGLSISMKQSNHWSRAVIEKLELKWD